MCDIIVIQKNSYIRKLCDTFIQVCKMVTLGQIKSPNITPINCKMITHLEQPIFVDVILLRKCTRMIKISLLLQLEENYSSLSSSQYILYVKKCQNIWHSLQLLSYLIFITREKSRLTIAAAYYQCQSTIHIHQNKKTTFISVILILNYKIEEGKVKIKSTSVHLLRFNHQLNFIYIYIGAEFHVNASYIIFMMKQFIHHNILLGPY